jgi:Na+-transporting NADH:ubiquinone oxidoreductase subunit B
MKPLRRFLDRLHPHFDKGGKLERLYPLYEAADTFLYTPGMVTSGPSHIRDSMDMKRMMITVVVALVPCIFMAMWNTGFQAHRAIRNAQIAHVLGQQDLLSGEEVNEAMHLAIGRPLDEVVTAVVPEERREAVAAAVPEAVERAPDVPLHELNYDTGIRGDILQAIGLSHNPESFLANLIYGALWFIPVFLVCNIVGGAWEALFAIVRRHEINEGFLVTGMLFPLILPPTIPLWQVAMGISFGVLVGKEIFGGTGKNFLNPALTARAFLYFAYPAWSTGDDVWYAIDGFTGATPLGVLPAIDNVEAIRAIDPAAMEAYLGVTWWQAFLGTIPGSMGETSVLACLLGAAFLILTGVGSWRIMLGMFIGGIGLAALLHYPFYLTATNAMFLMPPHWHIVTGGFMFGLVFMATDPVSASMTDTGKWFYGFLIGAMTVLIRVVNPAFPEGTMLAILFGNVFAPLIDYGVVQANIRRRLIRNAA